MSAQADAHFSTDYQEARQKFIAAATAAGARLQHHELPGIKGPDGRTLYLDVAALGPADADVVLLSLCGTHGAEGFCGSAAQICWLRIRGSDPLPQRVAVVLVHAVNPFGFAHMVRYNENNVDLNRNFIDFDQPLPENPLYEAFHARLPNRAGLDEDLVEEWALVYEAFWKENGDWVASDATGRGQYTRPDGIQFGGTKPEWSSKTLLSVVAEHCRAARHVIYIDWHSLLRLGDGRLVFLCFNQTGDPLYQRVGSWWTAEAISRETVNRQWGEGWVRAERRPSRNGLVMWGLQHALAPKADLAGAVIEFCADADRLNDGLRFRVRLHLQERWLITTRGYETPTGRDLVARLRETTSPTRNTFETKAIEAAMDTYAKALQGAARWADEDIPAQPGRLVRSSGFQ
jgi:hypothetical protein